MPLHQRCPHCREFQKPEARVCSHCRKELPRSRKHWWGFKWKDGKRITKSFGEIVKADAAIAYADWIRELEAPQKARVPTWGEIAEKYLRKLEVEEKPALKNVKRFMRFFRQRWGDVSADDIKPSHVEDIKLFLRSCVSPAYVDLHLAYGSSAFTYACPDLPNPFKRVKKFRPDNRIVRMLTPDEESRLLAAAKEIKTPWLYEIVLTALCTGFRLRNCLSLHVTETDFGNMLITIRQKGNRTHSVPLIEPLASVLKALNPSASGLYFPSGRTGEPYRDVDRAWAKAKALAGIVRPFRFHDLRHSFASKLGRACKNPRIVQAALGHSSLKMTERYHHVWDEDIRAAMQSLSTDTKTDTRTEKPQA